MKKLFAVAAAATLFAAQAQADLSNRESAARQPLCGSVSR